VTEPEVVLSYENERWRARGAGLDLTHSELADLDALVAGAFQGHGPTRVHMRFDVAGLPVWLRQYHAHYCNYVLRVAPRSERA
jgi:hypothetical protein